MILIFSILCWLTKGIISPNFYKSTFISKFHVEGMIKISSQPFGNDRAEIWPLFLNIISLCLDALSQKLFQFAYPFKIEAFFLVPQVLINSIYDTFSAFKFLPGRLVFRFGNRCVQKSEGIWGMRKDLEAAFSGSSHGSLRVHYLARTEHQESTFLLCLFV